TERGTRRIRRGAFVALAATAPFGAKLICERVALPPECHARGFDPAQPFLEVGDTRGRVGGFLFFVALLLLYGVGGDDDAQPEIGARRIGRDQRTGERRETVTLARGRRECERVPRAPGLEHVPNLGPLAELGEGLRAEL